MCEVFAKLINCGIYSDKEAICRREHASAAEMKEYKN